MTINPDIAAAIIGIATFAILVGSYEQISGVWDRMTFRQDREATKRTVGRLEAINVRARLGED